MTGTNFRPASLLLVAVLAVTCVNVPALAQQTGLGTVRGTVLDATGAVIPGASVTLTNEQTNVSRRQQTNEVGIYEFPAAALGPYKLEVEMTGFKRWEGTFNLQAGQTAMIDPRMEVGAVDTVVEVTGAAAPITTEGMEVADVKDSLRIRQLPLNGRAITNLFELTPGVEGGGSPRVNGMKVGSTEMTLDGMSLVDRFGGGMARVQPGLDTIEEFRIETTGSNARNSRPATVTLVTKSGTNEFHGSAFSTHRNNAAGLRARQRQDFAEAAKLIRNEFGISGGGPIVRDKTFLFAAFEGVRIRQTTSLQRTTVPTASMWNGDFGGITDSQGNPLTIYNPFSTGADGRREPFANQVIPQSMLNEFGRVMQSVTPEPNVDGGDILTGGFNFQTFYPITNDTSQYTIKGDHSFSTRDTLSARFTRTGTDFAQQGGRFGFPPPGCTNCGGSSLRDSNVYNGMARWTRTFSPTLINELQVSSHRSTQEQGTLGNDTAWADMLGLPNPFNVTGWPTLGGAAPFPSWDSDNRHDQNLTSHQIDQNVTWIKGKHSVQFGAKLRQEYNNIRELQQAQGSHTFGSNWTQQWNPTDQTAEPFTGFGLASVVMGTPTALRNQANRGFFYFEQFEMGLYFHDSWKIGPRTTLEVGVRYDRWAPYGEKQDRLVNLDMNTVANTFQVITPGSTRAEDVPGILPSMLQSYATRGLSWVTADSVGFPSRLLPPDNNNFGPRLGIAHRLTDKFVLRAGYGEYFWTMPLSQILQAARGNPPFNLRYLNIITDKNGRQPFYALTNVPGPDDRLPTATVDIHSEAGLSTNAMTMDVWDVRDWRDNRMQSWHFTLERELMRDTALRMSYIGTHGRDIEQKFNANAREAQYNYQLRTGMIVPGVADLLRVNRDWNLRPTNHTGFSNSHSLQTEVERRYSNGLAFQWFYAFNRTLTTNDAGGFTAGNGNINASGANAVFGVPENIQLLGSPNLTYDERLRLGYFNSGAIPAHRVRWNGIYDLPFGQGKKYGGNASGALNQVIGGWQIATIGNWRSGQWSSVASNQYLFGDPTLDENERLELTFGGRRQRVFFRGNFNPALASDVDQAGLERLVPANLADRVLRPINPARNDNTIPMVLANGSVRNTPITDTVNWNARNFFRGAGQWNADISVFKHFYINEDINIRFTADFFNAFNTPMDVNPNSTTGLQDLSVQANEPRIIQFSLRLNW